MTLTTEESNTLKSARLVARLWVYYEKNDEKTIKALAKADIGPQEDLEYLLGTAKTFVNSLGEQF